MNKSGNIQNEIVKYLAIALLSFLGFLLLSIFSDVLPIIFPALKTLPLVLLLKIILLLLVLSSLSVILNFILWFKSKPYKPNALNGKLLNIPWHAEMVYPAPGVATKIDTRINFLCPKHKTHLQDSQEPFKDRIVKTVYCKNCKDHYHFKSVGSNISLPEAWEMVRSQILNKVH